ncbi:MAG: AbrB/MazE/SpoVT family DNA-binding domain-containing protein [Candidatus Zapsychrus exili]|nr:AbrB/MazE/SpoVT family DNA-binding domain-containing protein [Candidatus Zapsychrus exili]
MTITEIAKITTKGQITIPNRIRKLLHLKEGSSVGFGITKDGVVLVPCEVIAKSPYTEKEWTKIEKLATEKGKSFTDVVAAKKYLKNL